MAKNNTSLLSFGSGGQKSEMSFTGLESRCWQNCIPSGSFRRESFPLPASRSSLKSMAYGCFIHLWISLALFWFLLISAFTDKDSVVTLGPQGIKLVNLISSINLFCGVRQNTHALEIRTWMSLGSHYSTYHSESCKDVIPMEQKLCSLWEEFLCIRSVEREGSKLAN